MNTDAPGLDRQPMHPAITEIKGKKWRRFDNKVTQEIVQHGYEKRKVVMTVSRYRTGMTSGGKAAFGK